MIDCPIYMYTPGSEPDPTPMTDDAVCGGCNCGYIQYESILPYLSELKDVVRMTEEAGYDLEFKIREQIVEISRLFDIVNNVRQGYFSKAHYYTTETVTINNSRYIRVPDHVPGTLEVRTLGDVLIDPSFYSYEGGYLVYLPCAVHNSCGCASTCGKTERRSNVKWPDNCYKLRAKWGSECSDMAVQKAIRDYLIESYRMQDPIIQTANGIPIQRKFQIPYSWDAYVKNFKAKRQIFSQYAIA